MFQPVLDDCAAQQDVQVHGATGVVSVRVASGRSGGGQVDVGGGVDDQEQELVDMMLVSALPKKVLPAPQRGAGGGGGAG